MITAAVAAVSSLLQVLGEPVVRVRVVAVARDCVVAGSSVHRDRLVERLVGVEQHPCPSELGGDDLELTEEPPAEAESAPVGMNPHPLDLGAVVVEVLDPAASDDCLVAADDEERARGRAHTVKLPCAAGISVESGSKAIVELTEVLLERTLCELRMGIHSVNVDGGGPKQSLCCRERFGQFASLSIGERLDESSSEFVRASIEAFPFATARGRESDDPLSPVDRIRCHRDEIVLLELSEHATEIARVEIEATSKVADLGVVCADLEQET